MSWYFLYCSSLPSPSPFSLSLSLSLHIAIALLLLPHATMRLSHLLCLLFLSTIAHGFPFSVPLLHRNSPGSPVRKLHASVLEAMGDAAGMDAVRLEEFYARLEHAMKPPPWMWEDEKRGLVWRRKQKRSPLLSSVRAGASAGSGQYLVSFVIGTPPQHFFLIADTGSDLLWLRCCTNTCSSSPSFHARSSSSFSPIACFRPQCSLVPSPLNSSCHRHPHASFCNYDYTYADLSETSGIFAYETAFLNSTSKHRVKIPHVAFGCGLHNTGKSFTGSGGVLALGRGSISFASQLGPSVDHRFSYCFADFFRSPSQESYMVFGKRPKHHGSAPFQYTPFLQNSFLTTLYYIGVKHIAVDGVKLQIHPGVWRIDEQGNGGTVIDTGTTLTYLLQPAYAKVLAAFKERIPYPQFKLQTPTASFDLCFNTSLAEAAAGKNGIAVPELALVLKGNAVFKPPPANYFLDLTHDTKCLGMQGVSSRFSFSILGNLLQQNFIIEYDRKKDHLGFVPANCSTASL